MGMRPIAVRSFGAAVALVLGFFGMRWGAQAALAAIAALASPSSRSSSSWNSRRS